MKIFNEEVKLQPLHFYTENYSNRSSLATAIFAKALLRDGDFKNYPSLAYSSHTVCALRNIVENECNKSCIFSERISEELRLLLLVLCEQLVTEFNFTSITTDYITDHPILGKMTQKEIVTLLLSSDGIDPVKLGMFLLATNKIPESESYLQTAMKLLDFSEMTLDEALRLVLGLFYIPGGEQELYRVLVEFSQQYIKYNNPCLRSKAKDPIKIASEKEEKEERLTTEDNVLVLSYAALMLHTDWSKNHSSIQSQRLGGVLRSSYSSGVHPSRIDQNKFRSIVKDGKVEVDDSLIDSLFESITTNPFKLALSEKSELYKSLRMTSRNLESAPKMCQEEISSILIRLSTGQSCVKLCKSNSRRRMRRIWLSHDRFHILWSTQSVANQIQNCYEPEVQITEPDTRSTLFEDEGTQSSQSDPREHLLVSTPVRESVSSPNLRLYSAGSIASSADDFHSSLPRGSNQVDVKRAITAECETVIRKGFKIDAEMEKPIEPIPLQSNANLKVFPKSLFSSNFGKKISIPSKLSKEKESLKNSGKGENEIYYLPTECPNMNILLSLFSSSFCPSQAFDSYLPLHRPESQDPEEKLFPNVRHVSILALRDSTFDPIQSETAKRHKLKLDDSKSQFLSLRLDDRTVDFLLTDLNAQSAWKIYFSLMTNLRDSLLNRHIIKEQTILQQVAAAEQSAFLKRWLKQFSINKANPISSSGNLDVPKSEATSFKKNSTRLVSKMRRSSECGPLPNTIDSKNQIYPEPSFLIPEALRNRQWPAALGYKDLTPANATELESSFYEDLLIVHSELANCSKWNEFLRSILIDSPPCVAGLDSDGDSHTCGWCQDILWNKLLYPALFHVSKVPYDILTAGIGSGTSLSKGGGGSFLLSSVANHAQCLCCFNQWRNDGTTIISQSIGQSLFIVLSSKAKDPNECYFVKNMSECQCSKIKDPTPTLLINRQCPLPHRISKKNVKDARKSFCSISN
eukprot:GHVP01011348.1.p1 GENE.GHVP01011348.1~~GHVP01011348.1.p1  ORF type:complete len:973 (+),score=163.83 GHVP01011348.1:882-3800(+)